MGNTLSALFNHLYVFVNCDLALINRAGGLYGRICTYDLGQDSPIQTDLARLIRCLLMAKTEQFNLFNVTGLH